MASARIGFAWVLSAPWPTTLSLRPVSALVLPVGLAVSDWPLDRPMTLSLRPVSTLVLAAGLPVLAFALAGPLWPSPTYGGTLLELAGTPVTRICLLEASVTEAAATAPTTDIWRGEARAARIVEPPSARTSELGAARSGAKLGFPWARIKTAVARIGPIPVPSTPTLAAQTFETPLASQFGSDETTVDGTADHGARRDLARIAILGKAFGRYDQKSRDGDGRDEKALHAWSPEVLRRDDVRRAPWTSSTVVAQDCTWHERFSGADRRRGGRYPCGLHTTVNEKARTASHFGLG